MSRKPKGKNAFTSLRINRVAEEEIMKYNNNAIHLSYSATKNNNNNNNNQLLKNLNNTKYTNGSSEMNFVQNTTYQSKNKNNSANKKNQNNNNLGNSEQIIKPTIQRNKSGIIINIYTRKNKIDKDDIIVNNENYCLDNDDENKTEKEEYEDRKNDNINESDAVNLVMNMWLQNIKIINESKFDISNVNNKKDKNIIEREINFNIISKNKLEKKLREESETFFTIYKTAIKEKFINMEEKYIKDLSNSIFIPKNNQNDFYIINPPNNFQSLNKTPYKLINPKDTNQLESQLLDYYTQNKNNFYTNIDINEDIEEQKLKPIYVLSKPQIIYLYNELNREKNRDWGIGQDALTISRQVALDYEILEVFTPRTNKDNNTNRTKYNPNYLDSNGIRDENENSIKNNSQDFGQYTPISMLNEKFFVYAISRNIKYSIPESQGFINYLNYDKFVKKDFSKDNLQKNKFSLKITKINKPDNNKFNQNNKYNINYNKKKINNIIDYSKYSSGSEKDAKINNK